MGRFLLKISVSLAVLVGTAFSGALAQQSQADEIPIPILRGLQRGAYVESYVAQILGQLRQADRDRNGLDRDDIKLAEARREAHARAASITQLLAFDLNGDFEVTREELEAGAGGRGSNSQTHEIARFDALDADRDGVITLQEMANSSPERPIPGDARLESLLALDPSGDGRLTAEELRKLAEDAFRTIDVDHNEEISEAEAANLRQVLRPDRATQQSASACRLPSIPSEAEVVVFGVLGAEAISSVAIGSPDKETGLLDVVIEPGSKPLYLILTSQKSVIWQLVGATERVVHVVASSAKLGPVKVSATGVIGIEEDKVTIARARCPRFNYRSPGTNPDWMRSAVRASTNRSPDAVFETYRAQRVALPSGSVSHAVRGKSSAPAGFDPALWVEASRFWPAGLVKVDPSHVVSKTSIEQYQVLPGEMGLSQLVGSGAVEQISPREYRQVKEIPQVPPDMNVSRLKIWTVAKGVPVPFGNTANLCLRLEGTDVLTNAGSRCLPQ